MTQHEPIQFSPSDISRYYSARVPGLNQTNGSNWRCPCPIHDGKRNSFSVKSDTGRWRCHSDCDVGGDIIDLEMRLSSCDFKAAKAAVYDLVGKRDQPRKPMPVAEYDYVDESGKLLFQAVRMEPKDFRQRHKPEGSGAWVWNINGVRRVLFRLPRVIASPIVFIAEGEKDVLSLEKVIDSDCAATCNPMGAGKWEDSYTQFLRGKRVVIVPDYDPYDPRRKPSQQFPGQRHAIHIQKSLDGIAAKVKFLKIPAPYKDFSDWAGSTVVTPDLIMENLTDEAPSIEPPTDSAGESGPNVIEMKPRSTEKLHVNSLARMLMLEHHWICNNNGYLWKYDGRRWVTDTDEHIRHLAAVADGDKWTTGDRRREVCGFIRAAVHNTELTWRNLEQYEVPAWNGVVDVRTGEIRGHRPDDMIETTASVDYDPDADCPRWKQALVEYFGDDPCGREKTIALQQFAGYLLMQHTRYKKALVLNGESDTGKSVVGEVMCDLVGRANVCSIPVHHMDDSRKIAPIVGMSLNFLAELSSNALIADGGFKTLVSTGDSIQIDPKFGKPFSYVPLAKHVILTNTLPGVNDRSRGTFNRMLIVRFHRVLPKDRQDKTIWDQLRAEMPGILTWAIEGARFLYESGGEFVTIPESVEIISEYRVDQNPMLEFIMEKCDPDEAGMIMSSEFRNRYANWMPPGTRLSPQGVTSQIRSAGYQIVRNARGSHVKGLSWRSVV